jgi:hypothetical protein
MHPHKLAVMLALLITPSCLLSGQTLSESSTGIEGVIAISPTPPRMSREAVSSPEPLMNAPFNVVKENAVLASFTTDDQGRFQVSVAPGHYTVLQPEKSQMRQCGPWEADVVAGQMTRVEWYCEMGGAPP